MKTSTILIAGAVGVAVLLLVPKIKSYTGFAANVNRGRGPPASFPGQGQDIWPGKSYAYGHNNMMLPPQARVPLHVRRGPRF